MSSKATERTYRAACRRGYLVIAKGCRWRKRRTASDRRRRRRWGARCKRLGRHEVIVFPAEDRWAVILCFRDGPDSELRYVRHEFVRAFERWTGDEPMTDEPGCWFGGADTRAEARGLARELVSIDAQPRFPELETVFEVHGE